jgi:hypothetical protein
MSFFRSDILKRHMKIHIIENPEGGNSLCVNLVAKQ